MRDYNTPSRNNQPLNVGNQPENFPTGRISPRAQFYRFSLACGTVIDFKDIEAASLSYIPCTHEQPLFKYAHLWDSPTQINLDNFPDAHGWKMKEVQGVQIFTGKPTKRYRDGITEYLTVLDVEVRLLERYPDLYQQIEQAYHHNIDGAPFVIQTKSGGRQFYGYVPDYHERKREFKDVRDNAILLEFLSDKCLARIDDRYRIETGSLLNIPTLSKETLQSIYHLIHPYAKEHQVSDHPTQTVERSQLGDLEIRWDEKGASQYFPAAQCQATDHKDPSRKTVQFRKWDSGIKGHCYNCGESWWEVEPPPIAEPPVLDPISPFIFSKIPELGILAKQVGGGLSDWTWQYPGAVNGQPREQTNRHLYNPLLKQQCSHCPEQVPTYIDIARLTAGPHCPECNGHQLKPETITDSYLQYELDRKPHDAIISDFEGYISDDPLLENESLWNQGRILHLGAPMGSGKTTLIYQRAREAAESGALTLVVVPRVSLARGVHADLKKDTSLGWGLFHEGHKGEIGKHGAICTLGWLPRLLKKIVKDYPTRPVRIFVDEIDFADSLRIAGIFKDLSKEIKEALKERKDAIGIVTAGQTAYTLGLEAIAKELDCNLTGYSLSPRPAESIANLYIFDTTDLDQGRNRIIQDVIDKAESVHAAGKHVYIFGDERRSAQIIADYFGDNALLYDKYHRQSPAVAELHRLQRLPDDKTVFIATPAVDVGVSLKDENAETIVFSVKDPIKNGVSSTVQQCLRNRTKPPLSIYLMKYQNALPLAPQQAIDFQTAHAKQKRSPAENEPEGLIAKLGIKDAMNSLETDQPETFFTHHIEQAGYQVHKQTIDWGAVDFDKAQETRKRIKDSENEQVKAMAREILCPERMLTEREIRNKNWGQLQPAPTLQLAHERANALLQATGWNGDVERFVDESNLIEADPRQAFQDAGVTDEMWEAAILALQVGLAPDKVSGWKKGYLTTHYPSAAFDEFEESREHEIHHRSDAIFIGRLAEALLEKLPRTPTSKEAVGQALIDAAQEPFGTDRLSALMKDGSVSPGVAKQVRFIDLGKDATATQAHFDFVKRFISEYYPARIAKVGDLYQLAPPQDAEQMEAFKQIMECRIKAKHPDSDPEPENGELTPPPAADPKAGDKALAIQMRNNQHSYREIAAEIGVSLGTVHSWCNDDSECLIRSENFLGGPYIENSLNTPSVPESPEPLTPTTFEADLADVGCLSDQTLDQTSDKADVTSDNADMTSDMTFRSQILEMLSDGERRTKEIVECIDGKRVAIMNELKRLCDAGEIIKVKWGVYDLPNRAHSIEWTDIQKMAIALPEPVPDVTIESNGKRFRLHVNRKPGQAEGEVRQNLFSKRKRHRTTMYAVEGGQASHPDTFYHHVVTDGQELAKCLDIVSRHIIRMADEPTVQQIKWLHERGIGPEGVLAAANPDSLCRQHLKTLYQGDTLIRLPPRYDCFSGEFQYPDVSP